jgi:carbon-monoxide dehydrogenase medium subunit
MYTMRPAEFDYHRPGSVEEAVSLLAEDGDARPLAGGHSLLPMMKLRLAVPSALVDLAGIRGLAEIGEDGDGLRIGALATHASVAGSELVQERCAVLAETAGVIGDAQVRNRGTIGGSVGHADPGADYPTVLRAIGATISVAGPDGTREIAADDFFTGVFETALQPGELVTAIRVSGTGAGGGAAYVKHAHPASGYAVVGVAAAVSVDGGSCTAARVAVGGAAPTAVRATHAEDALTGAAPTPEAIAAAAEAVPQALPETLSDTYASGEYRAHLATVLAKRALTSAFERAGARA